jgi:uncharacterized protein
MKFKLINESGPKTYAIIFDKGDEVIANLQKFATQQHLLTCHFTAIGAFNDVVLGFFQPERKEYKKIPIHEQVEVLSLAGDVSLKVDLIDHTNVLYPERHEKPLLVLSGFQARYFWE